MMSPTTYRIGEDEKPSTAAVLALAEELGTSQQELPQSLHAVVEPDALDALVSATSDPVTVQFQYEDRVVTVESDGTVEVTVSAGRA
jgi:hypothetical protein